jgi:hypothetical protein
MATRPDYASTADWREVDTTALPTGLAALYSDYKAAQRLATDARTAFEAAFSEMANVPASQRLGFGYRFGKLSVAVLPNDRPTAKPRKATLTLASLSEAFRSI